MGMKDAAMSILHDPRLSDVCLNYVDRVCPFFRTRVSRCFCSFRSDASDLSIVQDGGSAFLYACAAPGCEDVALTILHHPLTNPQSLNAVGCPSCEGRAPVGVFGSRHRTALYLATINNMTRVAQALLQDPRFVLKDYPVCFVSSYTC